VPPGLEPHAGPNDAEPNSGPNDPESNASADDPGTHNPGTHANAAVSAGPDAIGKLLKLV